MRWFEPRALFALPAVGVAAAAVCLEKTEPVRPEVTGPPVVVAGCGCEGSRPSTRPKFASSASEEIATLEQVQIALSNSADGTPFVWRRPAGSYSGVLQPTATFRDREGKLCRHVVLLLTSGARTSKIEGVACRRPDRRWQLAG